VRAGVLRMRHGFLVISTNTALQAAKLMPGLLLFGTTEGVGAKNGRQSASQTNPGVA